MTFLARRCLDMNVRSEAALIDEVIGFIKAFGSENKAS